MNSLKIATFGLILVAASTDFALCEEAGISKTEVRVGTFLGLSGDFALAARDIETATEVYFSKVNDAGGVNGRKLKFITVDDGLVPSRSSSAARRLVDQDNVFAILNPLGTPNALAAMSYLDEKGIPMLGIHGFSPKLFAPTHKWVFGDYTPFDKQMQLMAEGFAKQRPIKQLGMVYLNTEAGFSALPGGQEAAKALGQTLVTAAVPYNSPDYRPTVLNLRDKGVTDLLMVLGPRDTALIVSAAREAGWNPFFGGHMGTADPLTIQLGGAATEGIFGVSISALPGWDAAKWPGVKDYQDDLAKYSPSSKPSAFGIRAYADAMVFVEALKRAGPNPTRAGLIDALEGMKDFATGIYPPISYSAQRHDGNDHGIIVRVTNGAWLPVDE